MGEGAQIDWAEHDRDARGIVPELADFDRAVARARRFAARRPGTAVVVTADHDTGGPAIVQKDRPGAPLEIAYLTGDHTALLVPLLVNGEPARAWVKARHQTDLARLMRDWLLEGR
jgi:alkaline phosphatase